MPKIFDNISLKLLPELQTVTQLANRADFCVGYFNLRGWGEIGQHIETWAGGENHCVRLLVGMQRLPQEEIKNYYRISSLDDGQLDNQTRLRLKKKLAEEFRNQLTIGVPTKKDQMALQRLASQIKNGKLIVRLYLSHLLHAKLYLFHRDDPVNPVIGYLGSSNLTLSGLSAQGELNIDVIDSDASRKLAKWFDDRWNDWGCVDISDELVKIIEESWAREEPIPPYHIYIKMAYHLSQEARAGLNEFRIPRDFGSQLFPFQTAAVKIAAHHLNKRGGVLIGDVVGLGKTIMACALARIFEDQNMETLIICPKNLVKMWEKYRARYHMKATVLSISRVIKELPELSRFRLVIIDESHNLRNREGQRYKAIRDYIEKNECRCILLSATPYNKTYLDLSNQLRLFVPEDKELGIKPERMLRVMGETEFIRQHQCGIRTLAAFEKSNYPDDWRELMRLYMVRRTRSFIIQNYAETDPETGRKFLTMEDGTRSYFPTRTPRTIRFSVQDSDPNDVYAKLYDQSTVDTINALNLPRYGLGLYIDNKKTSKATRPENMILASLSKIGPQLMGFCRTNLFKRLESSGYAFLLSLQRHIIRNFIFIHALENGLPLPIGTQDASLLDTGTNDQDVDQIGFFDNPDEDELPGEMVGNIDMTPTSESAKSEATFRQQAQRIYGIYRKNYASRFDWLPSVFFNKHLLDHLLEDSRHLIDILVQAGDWDWTRDTKLSKLLDLVAGEHVHEKVLIFTQFADTVAYLETRLKAAGVSRIAGVVGNVENPTDFACRFSPISNEVAIPQDQELRVLVATDVLSEGQNLQDGYIIVNYDLPWAIVRLIQRAGRVDRIGQKSDKILCYSFLPADGVEKIIQLRSRVSKRLHENAEVVGTDEAFFEDDDVSTLVNLYNEKSGILDGSEDNEVDLSSFAYQIWKNAITANPGLRKSIEEMPATVFTARDFIPDPQHPCGALVYVRTSEGNDALSWIDETGRSVTESQFDILRAAECHPDSPALSIRDDHHDLVKKGVELIVSTEKNIGGQLGRPSGARFRVYERLKRFEQENRGTIFVPPTLSRVIDDIYRYPLREGAKDILNRQMRSSIQDADLVDLIISLWDEDRLCIVEEEVSDQDPKIICSLGLNAK